MSKSPESTDGRSLEWGVCDAGTLCGLGQRLRTDHTRGAQKRLVGGALAATAAAVLAIALWPAGAVVPSTTPNAANTAAWPGGIACGRCLELMPAYHDQLVSAETNAAVDLSAANAEAVAAHLDGCSMCREHFEEVYPGALAAATAGLGLLGFATRRIGRG